MDGRKRDVWSAEQVGRKRDHGARSEEKEKESPGVGHQHQHQGQQEEEEAERPQGTFPTCSAYKSQPFGMVWFQTAFKAL